MKHFLCSTVLRTLAVCCLWIASLGAYGQTAVPQTSQQQVATGRLDYYPQFQSAHITPRDVNVWLPPGYEIGQPCDVLYMHDGQMLFDGSTTWNHQEWEVDEVVGRLIMSNAIRRCIVVGINNINDQRFNEYFPQQVLAYARTAGAVDGGIQPDALKADAYLKFIVTELKPFIDGYYRPLTDRDHTFIMGSSMGGLISLYAMCEYPNVFGGAACLSTHLPLALKFESVAEAQAWAAAFRMYVADKLPAANTRWLYMDRGTVELDGMYQPFQDEMDAMLRAKGWDSTHFRTNVFDGHKHMETFWAMRLDQPLRFLFQPQ